MGIIFDLDGTLLNSLEDLKNCLNTVLKKYNLPEHDSAAYQNFVGSGMKALVDRALPTNHPDRDVILEEFLEEYSQRFSEKSRPYDGIIPMLKALNEKNIPISISTNKKQEYTDELVKKFFSEIEFVAVEGDKFDGRHKPNPFYPLLIAEKMQIDPKNLFFIGDSDIDMQTSINANMKGIGVSWGFRSVEELEAAGAQAIINQASDVLDLL